MSYIINYSGGTITIPVNTADTTNTSLTLIGRNWTSANTQQGFGQALNQNFVNLLQNFANSTQPISPLKGQFWYDTSTDQIKVNKGTQVTPSWDTLGSAGSQNNIASGTSNVSMPVADGNVNTSVGGVANVFVVTSTGANLNGTLDVTGAMTGVDLTLTGTLTLPVSSSLIIQNVTATGNVSSGNVGTGNVVATGTVTATGNITGGNLSTAGNVISGNLTTGNVTAGGNVAVSGNIAGGNISTTGNIAAGNLTVGGRSTLGAIGNLTITGGTSGQALTTNGVGVLSWSTVGNVLTDSVQTLTNKTISVDDNTLSGLAAQSFVLTNGSGVIDGSALQKTIPVGNVVGTSDIQILSNKTLSNPVIEGSYTEDVFVITDAATVNLDPNNGTIQLWVLGGDRTPGQINWNSGQSMTIMINDGAGSRIFWTSLPVNWIGGTAPTLATSGFTVVELWKVSSTIYGALVGAVA